MNKLDIADIRNDITNGLVALDSAFNVTNLNCGGSIVAFRTHADNWCNRWGEFGEGNLVSIDNVSHHAMIDFHCDCAQTDRLIDNINDVIATLFDNLSDNYSFKTIGDTIVHKIDGGQYRDRYVVECTAVCDDRSEIVVIIETDPLVDNDHNQLDEDKISVEIVFCHSDQFVEDVGEHTIAQFNFNQRSCGFGVHTESIDQCFKMVDRYVG